MALKRIYPSTCAAWTALLCLFFVSSVEAFVIQSTEIRQQQSTSLHMNQPESDNQEISRRKALASAAVLAPLLTAAAPALAAEDEYIQQGNGFAFRFVPPPEMELGGKPVKTHLFEVNWKSPTLAKYTFGVTVDPVRIQSLKEFGTPEEVAAKVVLAEVNRDGIFEVTLVKDPVAVEEDGVLSYILNYLSQGKRGDKRFVAKFSIQNQRLYALTGQVAEADYKDKEEEMMKAINCFRVLTL